MSTFSLLSASNLSISDMDFLTSDDETTVMIQRTSKWVTMCPYGVTAYVKLLNRTKGLCASYEPDYGHCCKDLTCAGYVEENPDKTCEFYTGSLGDAVYVSRKGYTPAYEPEEEVAEKEPDEEVVEPAAEVQWPTMSDAELRKAERKRVNRR